MHIEKLAGVIVRCEVQNQQIVFFVNDETDIIQKHHFAGQFYEKEELTIIARHFRSGGTFMDVGANVGNHSIYAARILNAGLIIPVEPNSLAIQILRINLTLNGLVGMADLRLVGVGLSDRPERGDLSTQPRNLGGTRVTQTGPQGSIQLGVGDDLVEGRHVDFIKIDVEGMEIQVLMGLENTIRRCHPNLFVEVDSQNHYRMEKWLSVHEYSVVDTFSRYSWNRNMLLVPACR
jgi:FkbM family methyltransferase